MKRSLILAVIVAVALLATGAPIWGAWGIGYLSYLVTRFGWSAAA